MPKKRMTDTSNLQPTTEFEVIHDWPETKSAIDAAMSCLRRYLAELNQPRGLPQEPSNKDLSCLFRYLAKHFANIDNDSPLSTLANQNIYPPVRQNSADSFNTWFNTSEQDPWNPYIGLIGRNRSRSTDKADTSLPGLLGSPIQHAAPTLASLASASQSHLDPRLPNLETLNSSALERMQTSQNETNLFGLQMPFSTPSVGEASMAYSNDTGQVQIWSQPSPTLTIPTSPFPAPNNSPTASGNEGPPATSSTPPTYAQVVARASTHSRTSSVVGGNKTNRFHCGFDGCTRSFDWEWKYRDHIVSHTQEKPYSCGDCNAHFGRERDLVKHCQSSQKHKKKACKENIEDRGASKRILNPARPGTQSPASPRRPPRGRRVVGKASQARSFRANSKTRGKSAGPMGNGQGLPTGFGDSSCDVEMSGSLSSLPHSSIGQGSFSGPRSVKRTHSDIDSNRDDDEYEEERGHDFPRVDTSFPYPHLLPQSDHGTGDTISPTLIQSFQQSHLSQTSRMALGPNTSSAYVTVPAITISPFHQSVSSGQGANWPEGSRTSGSSTTEDETMAQFIDWNPTQQPIYWLQSNRNVNVETNPRGLYPQSLQPSSYYSGERDGEQE